MKLLSMRHCLLRLSRIKYNIAIWSTNPIYIKYAKATSNLLAIYTKYIVGIVLTRSKRNGNI